MGINLIDLFLTLNAYINIDVQLSQVRFINKYTKLYSHSKSIHGKK